jgi:arginine deiminase
MGLKKRPEPSLTLLLPSDDMRSQKSTRHQWLTPVILATQETEIRRITIKTSWKKKKKKQLEQVVPDTISENKTAQNRADGMAQAIERLPNKHEALSSKHSTTYKKEREKGRSQKAATWKCVFTNSTMPAP